jgi:ORF6N domain
MAKELIISDDLLVTKIIEIRGQKVMIDKDLAEVYSVPTKRLNEQVKRNKKRFPVDFMFQLTKTEKEEVVAKCDHLKTLKFSPNLPFAFTEHGAVMLASILNSDRAIEVNVRIVKLFNAMRFVIQNNQVLQLQLEKLDKRVTNIGFDVKMHDSEIETLFELIDEWRKEREEEKAKEKARLATPRTPIGYPTKSSGRGSTDIKQVKSKKK